MSNANLAGLGALFGTAGTLYGTMAAAQVATATPTIVNESMLMPVGICLAGMAALARFVWWVASERQRIQSRVEEEARRNDAMEQQNVEMWRRLHALEQQVAANHKETP